MSEQEKIKQIENQIQVFNTRFNTAVTIANKPLNDIVEAYIGYIQTVKALVEQKDTLVSAKNAEIEVLKGKLLKEVNKDVIPPA